MEIDEHLKYTLFVAAVRAFVIWADQLSSLQFDPCPRAGEPMVSRRMLEPLDNSYINNTDLLQGTPDYFL